MLKLFRDMLINTRNENSLQSINRNADLRVSETNIPSAQDVETFFKETGWREKNDEEKRSIIRRAVLSIENAYASRPDLLEPARCAILNRHPGHRYADISLPSRLEGFLHAEKLDAEELLAAAESHIEEDNLEAADACLRQSFQILWPILGKDTSGALQSCRRAFTMWLAADEVNRALEIAWEHPNITTCMAQDDALTLVSSILETKSLTPTQSFCLQGLRDQLKQAGESAEANTRQIGASKKRRQLTEFTQAGATRTQAEVFMRMSSEMQTTVMEKLHVFKTLSGEDRTFAERWLMQLSTFPFLAAAEDRETDITYDGKKLTEALDKRVYGHEEAKAALCDFVHTRARRDDACTRVLALQGPPGNGKSTLVDALEEAIGVPVLKFNLSGAASSSTIFGLRRGLVGSGPGDLFQKLAQNKHPSPILVFEEIDKISGDWQGQALLRKFIQLTDSLEKRELIDDYFEGISFDLSKSMFIFTLNDVASLDPVFRTRLHVLSTTGYDEKEKTEIFTKILLPRYAKKHGFSSTNLQFTHTAFKVLAEKSKKDAGVKILAQDIDAVLERAGRLMHDKTWDGARIEGKILENKGNIYIRQIIATNS